jgi:hypothetical protein
MYKKKMKTDRTKPGYDNITEPLSNAKWESILKHGDVILKGITDCIGSTQKSPKGLLELKKLLFILHFHNLP